MKYIPFLFTALLVASCNFLSDVEPSDQLSAEEVFQTAHDLEAALTGAYDGVQHGSLLGRNTILFADLMTDNVDYRSGDFLNVAALQMDPTDFYAENLWAQGYKTINHLNAILDALPRVAAQDASLTEEGAERIEGETLFLRGVIYFELARLFCQPIGSGKHQELGLPLMLEPVLSAAQLQFPARSSIAETYARATADIEKARALLPETAERGRANRYAALAYLARIAFQQEDYATAAALAGEIIGSSRYSLTPTPERFFVDEGSSEEIWAILATASDEIEGGGGLSSIYHPSGPNEAYISDDLKKNGYEAVIPPGQLAAVQNAGYAVVDLRYAPPLISADTTRTNKYENGWIENEDDAPIARLAEFLLMRAEALARTEGVNEESIALLNQVRERSLRALDSLGRVVPDGAALLLYRPEDFADEDALTEAVILERRVELAFEGYYFHDLMRRKAAVRELPYDDERLRLPIPQREVDANPNLVQNGGY
ncbi:MAG: RagB/SusD family nutrient uptake outer membrane protein, partial [Phaeodactylibacter sp.]|nr:RagB/SusD family nutrient uptake outer membrane protein [Phaeodactylibacter sp.]